MPIDSLYMYYIYVLQIFSKFYLTIYLNSCELICSSSLMIWCRLDCKLLGRFFQTLLYIAPCYGFMLVFGGMKLQLCNSTIHNLMRECLLHSFLRWITMVQVSCLFSTLNCSKKILFLGMSTFIRLLQWCHPENDAQNVAF